MLFVNTQAIEAVNNGTATPKTLMVNGERSIRLKWQRTDGWRGFYEATPIKKYGWEPVKADWLTGDWDDAPAQNRAGNVVDDLKAMAAKADDEGYDILAVFAPTSNVFSTAYDVFRRPKQEAKV